ncbi:MAG TPA: two-component sensor histidine kinase [Bacteroidales bacterium]|nr:two-component sensor histidine kinase [Bacteroidales bacterium]
MLLQIALWVSMFLQIAAAIVAVSLIKRTRYNVSWILISTGFVLMAFRRLFEVSSLFWETQIVSKEEINTWVGVIISLLMLIGLIFIRQIFNLQDRLEKMRKVSESRLLAAVIRGEERARQTIARDLHDGLGPLLSSIKMMISAAEVDKIDPDNRKIIEKSCDAVDEAILTLKEISNHLNPRLLKNYGLTKAIEKYAVQLLENRPVKFIMESDIDDKRFFYDMEINIYRIITELLNNSLQHGNPEMINLKIFGKSSFLSVVYSDDGKGFNLEEIIRDGQQRGMGLENVRSRVKSLDGYLYIDTAPGSGFSIVIHIPFKRNEET